MLGIRVSEFADQREEFADQLRSSTAESPPWQQDSLGWILKGFEGNPLQRDTRVLVDTPP